MTKDNVIMMDILALLKGQADLYLHGTIEAACPEINETFKAILNECLILQKEVFDVMEQNGWYKIAQETQKNIDKVKKKFETGI